MFYSFDVTSWLMQQLPAVLRRSRLVAFMKAMTASLEPTSSAMRSYASQVMEQLSYNALTIYLQHFLNSLLDLEEGSIYIVDYIDEATLYLSLRSEGNDDDYMSLRPGEAVYLTNSDAIVGGFTVMVPEASATDRNIADMTAWINYYKYAGTSFNFKTY